MSDFLFTSESVTRRSPRRSSATRVSDAILDAILAQDPGARVATRETLAKTGFVMAAGEITTSCYVDIPKVVRQRP